MTPDRAITRREMIVLTGAAALALSGVPGRGLSAEERERMYGLIGKMKAAPGQRDALIEILLAGTGEMPGCLSYVVAKDSEDADAIWITEVWDSRESHAASLSLPAVQEAIAKGRPMIAGFGERFETEPVGGFGLAG